MSSASYTFSFVLGLVVVIVFLVVLNSRFNFVSSIFRSDKGAKVVAVSPTPKPTEAPTSVAGASTTNVEPTSQPIAAARTNTNEVRGVTQIPNTGFPTAALALLPAAFSAGVMLRKSK